MQDMRVAAKVHLCMITKRQFYSKFSGPILDKFRK